MDFDLNEEQRMYQRAVRDFCESELKPYAAEVDETGELRWEAIRKMPALGLTGLQVPEEYGGAGLDTLSQSIAIEELGWACGSTALAISAHNCLGLGPLVDFGSEELKRAWLPRLATGKGRLGCLTLTEPGAGSDLQGGVRTTAAREGDSWVINGAKMWATNASIADTIIVLLNHGESAVNPAVKEAVARGAGFMAIHYGVEVKKGEQGENYLKWLGGYFEPFWSVNPHWTPDFKELPKDQLKVDSDEALEIARKEPLLDRLDLKASQLKLERLGGGEDIPVWKVRFWAARLSNPNKMADVGEVMVSAETGKVVRNELKPNRVD